MTEFPQNIEELLFKNVKWAEYMEATYPGFFLESAEGQSPLAIWIGCADSRVPESVITDSKPGVLFVHRNIANQFPLKNDNSQSVVDYAVQVLGVKHIIVTGHTRCGGVEFALKGSQSPVSPTGTPIERWLAPLTDLARDLDLCHTMPEDEALALLTEENVKLQLSNLARSETLLQAGDVWIHGWIYDLAQGLLRDLKVSERVTRGCA